MTKLRITTSDRTNSLAALGLLTLCVLPVFLPSSASAAGSDSSRTKSRNKDPRVAATKAIFDDVGGAGQPGCSVLVSKHGQTRVSLQRGETNIENGVPIIADSVFDVGSVSKQFTAAGIQLLVGDGRLSLSDDVRRFVPELPDYGRQVTIEQLLHHTSGLGDYGRGLFASGKDLGDVVTAEQTLAFIASQKDLAHEPGTKFLYSNSGYFVLSLVIERVSGMSMNDFTTQRIFQPLGMTQSRVAERYDELIPNRAEGYKVGVDGSLSVARSNWQPTGDGQVRSTVGDLTLWAEELITGAKLGGQFQAAMVTPGPVPSDNPNQSYGSGLYLSKINGLDVIGHGGQWVGFQSDIRVVPDQGLSVVTLCNIDSIYPQVDPDTFIYPGRTPLDRDADIIGIWTKHN